MKLEDILVIEGKIKLLTGLHIGAGNDQIKIGGVDNPVVRDPVTKEPYIPGSSIKGKMRMLLELYLGAVDEKGNALSYKALEKLKEEKMIGDNEYRLAFNLLKLFGVSGADSIPTEIAKELGTTRLSFYDVKLTEDSRDELRDKVGALMTEEKAEVRINRITGTGSDPRHTERVPAGAEFKFKLLVKVFNTDNKDELLDLIKKGLKLLEADSLGGSGSRGYGKIEFEGLKAKSLFGKEEEMELSLDKVSL
jgi:CRISPR-associated protein Csm3